MSIPWLANIILSQIEPGLLGKRLIPELWLGKYKRILKHFVVPESKEVLKECWVYIKKTQQLGTIVKEVPIDKFEAI